MQRKITFSLTLTLSLLLSLVSLPLTAQAAPQRFRADFKAVQQRVSGVERLDSPRHFRGFHRFD